MKKKKFIPPDPVPFSAIKDSLTDQKEHEERAIREYVESQARDETVVYLEKVKTEVFYDRRLDAWDVHTDQDRYWVITEPTNLYSQKYYQSLDYTISFHIGVTLRVAAQQHRKFKKNQIEKSRLSSTWRRLSQAMDAFEAADEAEEFQAVGMRCRECLLDFVRNVADSSMVIQGTIEPKKADFLNWSQLIAKKIAGGSSSEAVRAYLTNISKGTWELVGWLTHARNAIRFDAELTVNATENVIYSFDSILRRYERAVPNRCPKCGSYKIVPDYRSDIDREVWLCEVCEWTDYQKEKKKSKRGA